MEIFHTIKCRFCSAEIGQASKIFPDPKEGEAFIEPVLTDADFNIGDSRCDVCSLEHGDYKTMHDQFLRDCGDYQTFKQVMEKTGYDQHAYVSHLLLNFPIPIAGPIQHDYDFINTERDKIYQTMGLDSEDQSLRMQLLIGLKEKSQSLTGLLDIPADSVKQDLDAVKKLNLENEKNDNAI